MSNLWLNMQFAVCKDWHYRSLRTFVIIILKYAKVYKYVTLPKCESIDLKQCNHVMRPLAFVFIEESCLMRLNMVEVLDQNGDGSCLEEGEAVIIIDSPCRSLPFQSSLAVLHSSRQAFARCFMVLSNAREIYGPKMDHLGFKNTLGNEIMRSKSLKIHGSLSAQLSFCLTVKAFKWSKAVIYP